MSYEKLSPEKFAENLKAGRYANLTGARRAIGKAEWPDATKDKVRHAAEKHFGGASTSTPIKKEKVVKTAKQAASKSVSAEPKKRGRPAKAKPESTEKVSGFTYKAKSAAAGVTFTDAQFESFMQKLTEISQGNSPIADESAELRASLDSINRTLTALSGMAGQIDLSEVQQSADLALELTRRLGQRFIDEPKEEQETPVSNGRSSESSYYTQPS